MPRPLCSPLPVLRERDGVRVLSETASCSRFQAEPSPRPSPGVPGEVGARGGALNFKMKRRLLRSLLISSVLVATTGVVAGDRVADAQPSTRPSALTEHVSGAKGLDAALRNLHAPMRESDPLLAEEAKKRFR